MSRTARGIPGTLVSDPLFSEGHKIVTIHNLPWTKSFLVGPFRVALLWLTDPSLFHWELRWIELKRNQGAKWLNSLPICREWRPPLVWTWAAWNRRGVVDSNPGSKILRFEQVPLGFGFLLCKVMGLGWGSFHLKNSTIYHIHRKWWLLNRGDWHFCLPAMPTLVLAENAYFQDPETPSNSLWIQLTRTTPDSPASSIV